MATSLKPQSFSDAKKALLHSRRLSHWANKVLTETGAWILAGFVYFAMVEAVLWIAALFSV